MQKITIRWGSKLNAVVIYKVLSKAYDLLDVIYFRNEARSPRNAVLNKICENDKVLDLCTGTATNAISIAENRPNSKIIGVDLSKDMLRVAREKLSKSGLRNIRLYQMDATSLRFRDKCFDKVLVSLILHEMEDELATKIISEAKRVLKDDGEIIITEWEPSRRLMRKIMFMPIDLLEPKPYKSFIKKNLSSYFMKYGLKINKYEHCDYTKVIVLMKTSRN